MNHYEILTLFVPRFSDEEIVTAAASVAKLITDQGGAITKEEHLGKRKLAYPIAHARQGFYELLEFDLEAPKLTEIERSLRLNQDVLRHQIVRMMIRRPEIVAAEKALQERLRVRRMQREQAQVDAEKQASLPPVEPLKPQTEEERKASLEALDQKLEELLTEDIVK